MRSPAPFRPRHSSRTTPRSFDDLRRIEYLAVCPVLENRESLVDDARRVGRDRQDVDGLVEARVRVEVRAEPHADRLEILDQVVLREMLRAVERRVLDEVREAELRRRLEHRAGVDDEAQLGALLRSAVLTDVVPDAVRQRADRTLGSTGSRVERSGRGLADGCCAIAGAANEQRRNERALMVIVGEFWGAAGAGG